MTSIQKYRRPEDEQNIYLKTITWVLRKSLLATFYVAKFGARLAFSIIKKQLTAPRVVRNTELPTDPHTTNSY